MNREDAINVFATHVSSGKVAFFRQFGMDFVMGERSGPFLHDLDRAKKLFNLHSNGGVFNLGHRHPVLVDVLKESLDRLDIGNHHLISVERAQLARDLATLMPGDLEGSPALTFAPLRLRPEGAIKSGTIAAMMAMPAAR